MSDWTSSITQYGYISLIIASFLHGAGLPIPAEGLLFAIALLLQQQRIVLLPALLLFAAANAFGVLIPYIVGKVAGATAVSQAQNNPHRDRVVRGLQQYGALMIAATRIIGFMRYVCLLLAGACGIPYYKVAVATFAGALIYSIGGLLLLRLGWAAISNFGFLLILPAIMVVATLIWLRRKRR